MTRKVALFSILLACLLWTPASEAVTIKGQPLRDIDDIVRTANDSEFPELRKHSIMLYERFDDRAGTKFQPRVFTVNNDGTLRKQHELEGYVSFGDKTFSTVEHFVQRMSLAMSEKRFGLRRTVMLTMPGMSIPSNNYEYNAYGFRTVETNGTEDSADISLVNPQKALTLLGADRVIWGNAAMTVKGLESSDIFVYLHSSHMAYPGDLYFSFFTSERNETGNVDWHDLSVKDGDINGWKLFNHSSGNRGAGVAAGDFDGDGYKNEIAVCWNDNDRVWAYIYRLTFANGQASVQRIYELLIHLAGYWGTVAAKQASPNVVTGDFNGDGKDEAAFVNKTFPQGEAQNQMRVTIIGINKKTGDWEVGMAGIDGRSESACKAARCDFDGDGKDELAILFFQEHDYALWPRLERWYCESGKIQPIRDTSHIIGGSNKDVLGYNVFGDYNRYYRIAEDFCLTAGPVTGTVGKGRLAEDVVISHVNNEASRVFVIPTQLDSRNNFAGFGETQKIYEYSGNDSARRGAVITGDFANEALLLGTPSHKVDKHDESYAAVLQTFPYHVDNVDYLGGKTAELINYTYSGFDGQGGNGEMNVSYTKEQSSSSESDVSFGLASTTETIGFLGKAGEFVTGAMKFVTTGANIAGNFDERAKVAGDVTSGIMKFFTDTISKTTTNATNEVNQKKNVASLKADTWDAIYRYTSEQHIWRYKILNKPLPSWYRFGPKADDSRADIKTDSKDYFITFSMYDDAHQGSGSSIQTDSYQPIHEEGNFFSYPSSVELVEGYNKEGLLDDIHFFEWTKGLEAHHTSEFKKEKIDKLKYDENIERSELTKTVSAIASFFGLDDPDPFPPYTSHNKSFTKSFSTSEKIEFNIKGRDSLPGEYAENTLYFVPYLAREGTMKVAMAVQLRDGALSPLWGSNSLYSKRPDPALLLPRKFRRENANLVTNKVASSAMMMRGMRFYVPELDLHSDTLFLAGLTYKVRVPIYNASFVKVDSFDVKLSYAPVGKGDDMFDKERPYITKGLKEIETLSGVSIGGWDNYKSNNNKKWLEFTFNVPKGTTEGDYVFYVQIDPGNTLPEVHDSRMNSAGRLLDAGGNNDGYFCFHITSLEQARNYRNNSSANASVRASSVLSPRGTIYRAVSRRASGNGGGKVSSSESGYGMADVSVLFEDEDINENGLLDYVTLQDLLDVFGDGLISSNGDESAAIEAEDNTTYTVLVDIDYNGDEYYPEAYLYGVNYKAGSLDSGDAEVSNAYMQYKISLVPHTKSQVVVTLSNEYMDYENGTGFEIVVPSLSGVIYNNEEDYEEYSNGSPVSGTSSSSGGCEAGFTVLGLMLPMLLFRKKSQ